MASRYEAIRSGADVSFKRIVVFLDEFEDFDHNSFKDHLDEIARKGREVRVSLVVSMQHATKEAFESNARRNLPGRIALKVENDVASRLVMGNSDYRADHLQDKGDAYIVAGGSVERVQCYYVPDKVMKQYTVCEPEFPTWDMAGALPAPELFTKAIARAQADSQYVDVAMNVIANGHEYKDKLGQVSTGHGREALRQAIKDCGLRGVSTDRLRELMRIAQDRVNTSH